MRAASWERGHLARDCVRVVIALVVTPDGFPLAYEVMPGNTADNTTLSDFLTKIEDQYGRSDRVWIMDRGIPTEATLEAMREGDAPVRYLVGTPKGRLTRLEKSFLSLPWQEVRQSVDVKLLTNDGELYVLVRSGRRVLKERGMRRRRLKKLWKRLGELRRQSNRRDTLMLKLGAAKHLSARETPGKRLFGIRHLSGRTACPVRSIPVAFHLNDTSPSVSSISSTSYGRSLYSAVRNWRTASRA